MSTRDKSGMSMNLLRFHRPKIRWDKSSIPTLKQESKDCLRNLAAYRPPKFRTKIPRSRSAAVLVALFIGRMGDLRSATLRAYAGDTSLPGGKVEPQDRNWEDTARREAFEEIGLPRDREKVPLLCILDPFLASNSLVVTPVVVLILDRTLKPILNHAEVTSLFSHPLESFLTSTPPFPSEPESVEVPYHTYTDWDWNNVGKVRSHRFLTGREAGGIKPVFGLTASILITTATIGYSCEPDFELHPPGGPTMADRINYVLQHNEDSQKASPGDADSSNRRSNTSIHRKKDRRQPDKPSSIINKL